MKRTLIVGAAQRGREMAQAMMQRSDPIHLVVGFIDFSIPLGTEITNGIKVLGSKADLVRVLQSERIEQVLACLEGPLSADIKDLIKLCLDAGVSVGISSECFDSLARWIPSTDFAGQVVVPAIRPLEPSNWEWVWKRSLDVFCSSLIFLLLLPLILLIALAIRLGSPGPIFYWQTRIGKNGQPFCFFKFRTMIAGIDDSSSRKPQMEEFIVNDRFHGEKEELVKIVDTSRVNSVGRFLRKTSLDELPQLWNVMRGEMSLVGPRPCLPYEWELYQPWHRLRFQVAPGCTGVWQVIGRGKTKFSEMVAMDIFYILNRSPLMDLGFLFKTMPVVLFGRGGG